MTVWTRITDSLHHFGDGVSHFLDGLTGSSTLPEKSMGFTIGMIALGAKMARADGVVSSEEMLAFRDVFKVPEKDVAAVERVFNLAQQDVAGFETYANQVARLFERKAEVLENVLDGLFHIAKADGAVHEDELEYLARVAEIFGFEKSDFLRIRARHVVIADDPYEIIGVDRRASMATIKAKHRKLVRELHPDKQMAAGVPQEMVRLATERLARINEAYDRIVKAASS
jgi:DnaJ like chaperone protein